MFAHLTVIVNGCAGTQLSAKLKPDMKPSCGHPECTHDMNWYTLWFTFTEMLHVDCLVDTMRLIYDPKTKKTSNQPEVDIKVPGTLGDTTPVEHLDPDIVGKVPTAYIAHLIDALEKNMGYNRNISFRGAAYDFRKAPNELEDYFNKLVQLVEDTYLLNNKKPVVLIAHSLGCLYILHMLNNQSQAWKDKYIRAFISIGGPYGGSAKALLALTSGYDAGIPLPEPWKRAMGRIQRTMPSIFLLTPFGSCWDNDHVLITAPTSQHQYTIQDYSKFFEDVHLPDGMAMRENVEGSFRKNLLHEQARCSDPELKAPNVVVHVIYGHGVKTPIAYEFSEVDSGNWYDYEPVAVDGDGDGSVSLPSLTACSRWADQQTQAVKLHPLQDAEHFAMIKSTAVAECIEQIVKDLQTCAAEGS